MRCSAMHALRMAATRVRAAFLKESQVSSASERGIVEYAHCRHYALVLFIESEVLNGSGAAFDALRDRVVRFRLGREH